MSANLKREATDVLSGSEAEKKLKVEGPSPPSHGVKVELKLNRTDTYEGDEFEPGKEHEYVDMADLEKCDSLEFMNYGYEGAFKCTRVGSARVSLDGVNIGEISFTLIDRERIYFGQSPPMVVVCDAETSDLYDVAFHHFDEKGRSKGALKKKLTAEANEAFFVYINAVTLKAPYDRTATEENMGVAAEAIRKFTDSRAFCNLDGEVVVTLFM
jgi:hypothetical protein